MRKPDFFIVGAPKCATSAMQSYLEQHPQIFMPAVKECHHFASDLHPDNYYNDPAIYRSLFEDARPDQVVGEASVNYLYSKVAARKIYEFNPEAKIIAMFRNPVEMIQSYHSQQLYNGNEDIEDLEEALNAEGPRRQGQPINTSTPFREKLYYSDIIRFAEQLERYITLFGRERVHVIIYDDLKRDVHAVYRDTLRFLGVDPSFEIEFKVVNANKRNRSRFVKNLMKQPPALLQSVAHMVLPLKVRHKIRRTVRELITNYEPRAAISPALRGRLQQEYAPEIDRLGALLGRDLSHWYREGQRKQHAQS